jgi:hypothetical protein
VHRHNLPPSKSEEVKIVRSDYPLPNKTANGRGNISAYGSFEMQNTKTKERNILA